MSPAVRTDRTDCRACKERVILARGAPPLDYEVADTGPLPGPWAVFHEASGAWTARHLLPGDQLRPGEHRHRVHECGEGL